MTPPSPSACGRFVIIETLYVDRKVFDALARWAAEQGIGIQDAIQIALCSFNEQKADVQTSPLLLRVHDVAGHAPISRRPDPGTGERALGPLSWRCVGLESERTPLPCPEP
jgi:hypothetical protein